MSDETGDDWKPEYDHLKAQLEGAVELLSDAAGTVRDLKLNSRANLLRIGEALVLIAEVSFELYERQPDLTPRFLRGTERLKNLFKDPE